jgi:hypothetical protein
MLLGKVSADNDESNYLIFLWEKILFVASFFVPIMYEVSMYITQAAGDNESLNSTTAI